MSWALAMPLLAKVTYSTSIFAARVVTPQKLAYVEPEYAIGIFVAFVAAKTAFVRWTNQMKPKGWGARVRYNIWLAFIDTHMATFLFVNVQWFVLVFERWWLLNKHNPLISIVVIDVPLFLAIGGIELGVEGDTSAPGSGAVLDVADNVLNRMIFAIAFFASSIITSNANLQLDTWDWMQLVLGFVALKATVEFALKQWVVLSGAAVERTAVTKAEKFREMAQEHYKNAVSKNWGLVSLTLVFTLADIYSYIVQQIWNESRSPFHGVVFINVILVIIIAVITLLTESDAAKGVVPVGILDRALFAMALFLAERAGDSNITDEEWYIFWLFIAVVTLDALVNLVFERLHAREHGVQLFTRTLNRFVTTWTTISVSFCVRLFVSVFQKLWQTRANKFAVIAVIEACLLLMIGAVHVLEPKETPAERKERISGR